MITDWLFLVAGLCILIGAGYSIVRHEVQSAEEEDAPPWGFNVVKDGGVCDGGEPQWESE